MRSGKLLRGIALVVGVHASSTACSANHCLLFACFEGLEIVVLATPGDEFAITVQDVRTGRTVEQVCGGIYCANGRVAFQDFIPTEIEVGVTADGVERRKRIVPVYSETRGGCGQRCQFGRAVFDFEAAATP